MRRTRRPRGFWLPRVSFSRRSFFFSRRTRRSRLQRRRGRCSRIGCGRSRLARSCSRDAAERQPRGSREAAEVQPRCSRGAAEVQPRCSRDAAERQPRCSRDAAEVQPRCSRGAAERQPRCSRDAAEVQPRCSRGAARASRARGASGELPAESWFPARQRAFLVSRLVRSCSTSGWTRCRRCSPPRGGKTRSLADRKREL